MVLKTQLVRLENRTTKYLFSIALVLWSGFQLTSVYDNYQKYTTSNPELSQGYKSIFYFYFIILIFIIAQLIFSLIIDITVKNKEKFLVIENMVLYIPSSFSKKVKEIPLNDIDSIGLIGLNQSIIKINMKTNQFFFAPRVFDAFETDVASIFKSINKAIYANNLVITTDSA